MNRVHYESYQEKDKMLLKVLDEAIELTNKPITADLSKQTVQVLQKI